MEDCSPEVLATSILQQRPSIVKTNSMLQKISKQIKDRRSLPIDAVGIKATAYVLGKTATATTTTTTTQTLPRAPWKGTPLASRVAQGVSGPSSSCVWNPRVFVGVSHEIGRGAQGASRVAPGKSGLHECSRGSASLPSSHGRGIRPQNALKKAPLDQRLSAACYAPVSRLISA